MVRMQDKWRESIGYALVRAFRNVNRASNRDLRTLGLSAEQAHILLVLWLEGPIKMGELQRALALSSGTLSGAIDRMEEAGLARRVRDPDDGRAWLVEAAPMPAARRQAIQSRLEIIEDSCFSTLTRDDRRELLRLLDALSASLE